MVSSPRPSWPRRLRPRRLRRRGAADQTASTRRADRSAYREAANSATGSATTRRCRWGSRRRGRTTTGRPVERHAPATKSTRPRATVQRRSPATAKATTPRCGGGEPLRTPDENPARAHRCPCLQAHPTALSAVPTLHPAARTTDVPPRTTHRMTTHQTTTHRMTTHRMTTDRTSRRGLVPQCRAGLGATGRCRVGRRLVGRAPTRNPCAAPTNRRCSNPGRNRRAHDRCCGATRGRHRCSRSVAGGEPTSVANEMVSTFRRHGLEQDEWAVTRWPTSDPRSVATSHRDRPGPRTRPVRRRAPDRPRLHRRRPSDGSYPQARHEVTPTGVPPFREVRGVVRPWFGAHSQTDHDHRCS
ncbi:hypothetical protein BDK89_0762 [Ilumatobacter fluminis]|uniref:Uncharacterized protein n=1 Tax=Ilumatobacter fluminis TaxID=467091 RepID=A0A4V6Q1V5_9ACTN|nr:hypothetical protein BDK89_0762 [Ilumatobacter fluminis]